jgi:hypothetical protein
VSRILLAVSPKCSGTAEAISLSHRYPAEAEFFDEIQTKVFRVFLLAIQSHLYSFALRFLFLQTHATSYRFFTVLLYTVKEKGGKADSKLRLLPRNQYRNFPSALRPMKIMPRNHMLRKASLARL